MASINKSATIGVPQETTITRVGKKINFVVSKFQYIAMVTLFSMMGLTLVDVIMRYVFKKPIMGASEVIRYLLIVQVFGTAAFGQVIHRHVSVTELYDKLPKRIQAVFISTTTLLTTFLFFIFFWQAIVRGEEQQKLNIVAMMTGIPNAPFLYFIAFGSLLLCIVLIKDFVIYVSTGVRGNREIVLRVGVACAVTALAVLAVWFGTDKLPVEPYIVGLLGFGLMIVLMFSGQPVGFAMALAGLIGVAFVRNLPATLALAGSKPFETVSYIYAVIPLFMLMGEFAYNGGLSRQLYAAAHSLVGRVAGGLAVANILASVLFGSICGDPVAACMAMGSIALPEMKKFDYDPGLACATIVAGGTVSALIPPSMVMIIYGLLTQASVSKLFIAGILPGIMNSIIFATVIIIRCKRNPALGAPGPSTTVKEKLLSIRGAWSAIILFGLIMGGIYGGLFTATEAGAMGAALALIIALATRGIGWKGLVQSLRTTSGMTSTSITLMVGAAILTYFLGISQVPVALAELVVGLTVPKVVIFAAIIAIYFFLGLIMPGMAMVIMTIPIFFPIITALGYDAIWFGVIVTVMMNIGGMTPPVGVLCFYVSSSSQVPLDTIFKNVWPFVGAAMTGIILLTIFPQIALWLPSLMSK